jgi:hypothetical protein
MKSYTCTDCGVAYTNRHTYYAHRARKHPTGGRVICCVVTKKLLTLAEFEANQKRTKNCEHCGKLFVGENSSQMFCSQSCSATVNGQKRIGEKRHFSDRAKNQCREQLQRIRKNGFNKSCIACGTGFVSRSASAKYCQPSCRPSQRTGRPMGGCRERSGRSKYGYYEGIWCQSTYEMAFVWKCKKDGKNIRRNMEGFPYVNDEGKERLYYPDFIVDDTYYEVKGWMTENVERKIAAFPRNIVLLINEDILDIVTEAKAHFGTKDLASIYAENKKPIKVGVCEICGDDFEVKPRSTGRFCSLSCSGKSVSKIPRIHPTTNKPSPSKLNHGKQSICSFCETSFAIKNHALGKYCSKSCAGKGTARLKKEWNSRRESNPHHTT